MKILNCITTLCQTQCLVCSWNKFKFIYLHVYVSSTNLQHTPVLYKYTVCTYVQSDIDGRYIYGIIYRKHKLD